jgi:predicted ATPase
VLSRTGSETSHLPPPSLLLICRRYDRRRASSTPTCLPQSQARRFIVLIDSLYNHKTRLVAASEVPIDRLFAGAAPDQAEAATTDLEGVEFEGEAGKAEELNPRGNTANALHGTTATGAVSADSRKELLKDSLFTGEDEVFAFRRALSRLAEMQSAQYLASRPRG